MKFSVLNREISWLSFNHRVLQEAKDPSVPLIERLRFLGIFSNNLDEFFRVRVATVKRMVNLGQEAKSYFEMNPKRCLEEIQKKVLVLQKDFDETFQTLLSELQGEGIRILRDTDLEGEQADFVTKYFNRQVISHLVPIMLTEGGPVPQIKDRSIYLAIKLSKKNDRKGKHNMYALMELPEVVDRFLVLPKTGESTDLILLDDIIRFNLKNLFHIFSFDHAEAYAAKLTRDAELDIEEDISSSLMEKLERSLERRKSGNFVRFVYDEAIPKDLMKFISKKLDLPSGINQIPGGRYHNFKDFIGFPSLGKAHLNYPAWPPLPHKELAKAKSIFETLAKRDVLLTYPYQSFNYVIDLLREAAIDPDVLKIKINVYRVAENSKIINALINAVKNGKKVVVVLELQARFDEKNNLEWSQRLQDEGVIVQFGVMGLKVHSKLILIERKEGAARRYYAHIGTGNFHEGNAKIYTDFSLLTSDQRIAREVKKVFNFLKNNYQRELYKHLLVSPFNMRRKLMALIHNEIKNAKAGKEAYIKIKINNLVDSGMIRKLYEASQAGVKIDCVVRGICSLIPGVPGMSENITAIGIIDRFLEHTRFFIFANGGDERYFISSADLMTRNLDRRVEVGAPIYDPILQKELKDLFNISFTDDVKARMLDTKMENVYVENVDLESNRSQRTTYQYFESQLEESGVKPPQPEISQD